MDTKRAFSIIYDVANMFDSADYVDREREQLMLSELPEEEVVITLGAYMGLSERELAIGTHSLPTSIYKKNPVFDLLSGWHFAELMAGKNGPAHLLKAIFGDKAITSMPTKEEEERVMIESVRARCDAKVLQINAMFPNTYPLHLPVHKFFFQPILLSEKGWKSRKSIHLWMASFLRFIAANLSLTQVDTAVSPRYDTYTQLANLGHTVSTNCKASVSANRQPAIIQDAGCLFFMW